MHLDKTTDSETLSGSCVDKLVTLLELTLIDSDICQLAVASVLELECQDDRNLLVICIKNDLALIVVQIECSVLNIARLGKILSDTVQKRLDSLVLVSRSDKDRAHLQSKSSASDCGLDHLYGRLFALKDHVHKLIVKVACGLYQLLALILGLFEH